MRAGHFLFVAPLLVACRGATEITVEVSTDLNCGDHAGTTITVGRLGGLSKPPTTTSFLCGPNQSVGTLVIVPSGSNDEEVAFQVTTGVGINPEQCGDPKNAAQCIIARRALRFIPHESLRVKVPMRVDCRGIQCDSNLTCVHGACVPATIDDSSRCIGAGCGDEGLKLGDGGITDAGVDAPPPGKVLTLALGYEHSCALMKNNVVWCWGSNALGQIGIGQDGGLVPTPMPVAGLGVVVGLSAFSEGHTCALTDDGKVACWGDACCGQLGDPKYNVTQFAPVPVTGLTGVGSIAVGRAHVCALGSDGQTVSCWGKYNGDPAPAVPTLIPGLGGPVETLGSGDNLIVIKMKDGSVRVVGFNQHGQLGLGNSAFDASTPTALTVTSATGVAKVANGNSFVIATLVDGGVIAWGEGVSSQLGLADTFGRSAPTPSPNLVGLRDFALGDQHACAIAAGDRVVCWGSGQFGQLGLGHLSGSATPVDMGITASRVFAGWHHNCAITLVGDVVCWGSDTKGQTGDGMTLDQAPPAKVLGL